MKVIPCVFETQEERDKAIALGQQCRKWLPEDLLPFIAEFHPAIWHRKGWRRVQAELLKNKPLLTRIKFLSWWGETAFNNNVTYANMEYEYARWSYLMGSQYRNLYKRRDKKLLQKGKAITHKLADCYNKNEWSYRFSIPIVTMGKWETFQTYYRRHMQLLRYYDYPTIESSGRVRNNKKEKARRQKKKEEKKQQKRKNKSRR